MKEEKIVCGCSEEVSEEELFIRLDECLEEVEK